jgi:hypothetical protein
MTICCTYSDFPGEAQPDNAKRIPKGPLKKLAQVVLEWAFEMREQGLDILSSL